MKKTAKDLRIGETMFSASDGKIHIQTVVGLARNGNNYQEIIINNFQSVSGEATQVTDRYRTVYHMNWIDAAEQALTQLQNQEDDYQNKILKDAEIIVATKRAKQALQEEIETQRQKENPNTL